MYVCNVFTMYVCICYVVVCNFVEYNVDFIEENCLESSKNLNILRQWNGMEYFT